MHDVYDPYTTAENISKFGVRRSKLSFNHRFLLGVLGGILLSFSGLFLMIVAGGSQSLVSLIGPGIHRAIAASVFPIGLILIVFTGADLFTGNTMIMTISTLHKKTNWSSLIISWSVSFVSNLCGCLIFQYIFVYYADLLTNEPYRSYAINFTELKHRQTWHVLFLRGIAGNWLVCLALWLASSGRELFSKVIGIYLPIWLFVSVGYEHSIANMFTVQMGMLLGADVSILNYVLHILLPVTVGNIIGGSIFVGFIYWYLYLKTSSEIPINSSAECRPTAIYNSIEQVEQLISTTTNENVVKTISN